MAVMGPFEVIVVVVLALQSVFVLMVFRRAAARRDTVAPVAEELRAGREEASTAARALREEVSNGLRLTHDTIVRTIGEMGQIQKSQLDAVAGRLRELSDSQQQQIERLRVRLSSVSPLMRL